MKKIEIVGAFKNFFLVERVGADNKTDSGLVVAMGDRKGSWYKILAVGPEAKTEYRDVQGELRNAKIGDLMTYHQGIEVNIDVKNYVVVADNNVLLIIPGDRL